MCLLVFLLFWFVFRLSWGLSRSFCGVAYWRCDVSLFCVGGVWDALF